MTNASPTKVFVAGATGFCGQGRCLSTGRTPSINPLHIFAQIISFGISYEKI